MSELTDRMRTCAAMLMSEHPFSEMKQAALNDAADLLIEASNMLSVHEAVQNPEGEPMELLQPVAASAPPAPPAAAADATWVGPHDTLPAQRSPKACPHCDSRAHKKVFRQGRRLMLACPVCAKEWPYG